MSSLTLIQKTQYNYGTLDLRETILKIILGHLLPFKD